MAVPNTFASATSAIPLANLDANFTYYDTAYSISGTTVAFNGNVGIGTTSPSSLLYVQSASTNGLVINQILRNPNGGSPVVAIGFNVAIEGDYTQAGIGLLRSIANGSGSLCFYNKGSGTASNFTTADEKMRIDPSGNVGIGTSSPGRRLDVSATTGLVGVTSSTGTNYVAYQALNTGGTMTLGLESSAGGTVFAGSSAYSAMFGTGGAYSLHLATNNTVRQTIDSSGNVGIGTSSPNASAILDAQSTTKGVRFPNMTTTQKNAISSPAAGLVVFDTTLSKLAVYSGSAWQTITSV